MIEANTYSITHHQHQNFIYCVLCPHPILQTVNNRTIQYVRIHFIQHNSEIKIMGQKSTEPIVPKEEIPSCVIDHPLFKEAKLLNDKQGEYIQISVPVINENQISNWEKRFKPLIASESLLLPLSYQFKKTELCGANGVCKIKYDNYPFLLKDEIHSRANETVKPFTNEQIWYLTYNLLEAASIFHQKGEKVGDIQPSNIFINDNGQTKVATQYSWPHEMINYQKTVYEKQITYLSPEEIKDLHFGLTESKCSYELSESFTIGLTLLDSTLLTNSTDLYSIANFRINYQKLDERRTALTTSSNVDEVLKQIILGLTALDPAKRLVCVDIFNWMDQYRENIVNMESFTIKELPYWIKAQHLDKRNVQATRLSNQQAPFYVEPIRYIPPPQQVYFQETRTSNFQAPLRPIIPVLQPVNRNSGNSQVEIYKIPPSSQSKTPFSQEVPRSFQQAPTANQRGPLFSQEATIIYESNYVQVPSYSSPTLGNKSDDFRDTLQKIDQQLAISRKMFPN